MKTVIYKIEDLISAEYNPRQISEKQLNDLKDSIKRFGFVEPVIVNINPERKNIIVSGHQRVRAAKYLGIEAVPCVEIDLTHEKEKELNVRMNKAGGEWDWKLLQEHFEVPQLIEWGFEEQEIKFDISEQNEKDDEVPDAPEEPITKLGDIILLGRHRLMCGDSTKIEDVERLMDGKKADMVFTSPPYNVGIKYSKHNDEQNTDDYFGFICDVIGSCFTVMNDGRLIAWNVGVSPKSKPYHHALKLEEYGFQLFRHIVWKKTGCQIPLWQNSRNKPNARHYMPNYNHEMIYMMSKGDVQQGTTTQMPEELSMDVWDVSQFSAGGNNHPAAFPVRLAELAIMAMTAKDEIAFEPFAGSGSQFIACEKTNRICYGMEIDPKYCDVIVKRWEDYTGQKAEYER